jgi:hypothetical protein
MLRDQFLGYFAQICHIPPPVLDNLRMQDFAKLVMFIEQTLKNQQQQNG